MEGNAGPSPFGTEERPPFEEPTDLGERVESERPPDDRTGSAWLGVPAMVGLLVIAAAYSVSHSLFGVLLAVAGLVVLFLAIGLAMTIAKRE